MNCKSQGTVQEWKNTVKQNVSWTEKALSTFIMVFFIGGLCTFLWVDLEGQWHLEGQTLCQHAPCTMLACFITWVHLNPDLNPLAILFTFFQAETVVMNSAELCGIPLVKTEGLCWASNILFNFSDLKSGPQRPTMPPSLCSVMWSCSELLEYRAFQYLN